MNVCTILDSTVWFCQWLNMTQGKQSKTRRIRINAIDQYSNNIKMRNFDFYAQHISSHTYVCHPFLWLNSTFLSDGSITKVKRNSPEDEVSGWLLRRFTFRLLLLTCGMVSVRLMALLKLPPAAGPPGPGPDDAEEPAPSPTPSKSLLLNSAMLLTLMLNLPPGCDCNKLFAFGGPVVSPSRNNTIQYYSINEWNEDWE